MGVYGKVQYDDDDHDRRHTKGVNLIESFDQTLHGANPGAKDWLSKKCTSQVVCTGTCSNGLLKKSVQVHKLLWLD